MDCWRFMDEIDDFGFMILDLCTSNIQTSKKNK